MSIIYSYPEQGALNANDMLIGTSAEKVGGKQKNITRNFTVQQIADFINRGAGFVDPVASDFQIPVFNQEGKKITGSIMSQNIYPNGSAITISGSLTVTNGATIGDFTNDIILQSPTVLIGPIKDANSALSTGNQILLSTPSGNVVWQNYEAGLTYEGTWNASTNTPALTSGQGVSGHFYIVNVAGNTNLDGNNDWHVGDWAVFFDAGGAGTAAWQKIDNTSVLTGSGTANTLAMWTATETLNDSLLSQDAGATKVIVDGLLEIKGDGTSQDGRIKLNCWNNNHGVTIQSPPHSAAQSWTWILPQTTGGANDVLTTDGNTPSQLSWTTPTTGTVTGTGTENYVTKWSTGGTGIEDSTIFDNGTNVGIGTASPSSALHISNTTPEIYLEDSNNTADAKLLANNGNLGLFSDVNNEYNSSIMYFSVDGSEKMRIDSAGNVGIGTTSPSKKLEVVGDVKFGDVGAFESSTNLLKSSITGFNGFLIRSAVSSDSNPSYSSVDDTNTGMFLPGSDVVAFTTAGSEKMRIDSAGNVGVNVIPQNSAGIWRNFQLGGGNITTRANGSNDMIVGTGFYFTTSNTELYKNTAAVSRAFFDNDSIRFQNAPSGTAGSAISWSERMRIDSSGNVGIGTTSPAVSLDISATDAVQMPVGVTSDRPTTGVASNGMLRYNSTNNGFEGYINGNWGDIGGGTSGGLIFRGTFNASTGDIAGGGNLTTGTNRVAIAIGDMYIVDTAGDFYGDTSKPLNVGDEVICVLDATVGTSDINDWNAIASGAGGAVTGSGTTNYVPKFTGATVVGNSSIYEDTSSNVGIGTAGPRTKFQVIGIGGNNPPVLGADADTAHFGGGLFGTLFSTLSSGKGVIQQGRVDGTATAYDLLIQPNGGNVGIGTDSPGAKLQVTNGTAGRTTYSNDGNDVVIDSTGSGTGMTIASDRASYGVIYFADQDSGTRGIFRYDHADNSMRLGTDGSEKMRIDFAGKVGIGTDQPQVSLDLGSNTDAIRVPNGANADRPSGILPGMIRYNTSTNEFEGYSGTLNVSGSWGALGGSGVPTISKQLFQVTTATPTFVLNSPQVNPQDANYVNIFIDGVYQNSGTYAVATATGVTTVTLSTNAPVGTSVEIISTT